MSEPTYDLIATCAFGLEAIVRRELQALGIEANIRDSGRVHFRGSKQTICDTNLWLRTSDRVLVKVAEFPAADFDALFETTRDLPWGEILPVDANFPVTGRSISSTLTSVPACQRATKRAIVDALKRDHSTEDLPETGAQYKIDIALLKDVATLTIDTTGRSLHRRGYRTDVSEAPLKETMASALVLLSFWKSGRPLLDPFCGSGTIPIEAARIGRNMAPGLLREFTCESWADFPQDLWQAARQEARSKQLDSLGERIVASDIDGRVLRAARANAERADVLNDIHFHAASVQETTSKRRFGCLITNPPYGMRLGYDREINELYQTLPIVFRKLPTWSFYILTAFRGFERVIGKKADRRRKLYNARIECTYYQFHGPRPVVGQLPESGQSSEDEASSEIDPSAESEQSSGGEQLSKNEQLTKSEIPAETQQTETNEQPAFEEPPISEESTAKPPEETIQPAPVEPKPQPISPWGKAVEKSQSAEQASAPQPPSGQANSAEPSSVWESKPDAQPSPVQPSPVQPSPVQPSPVTPSPSQTRPTQPTPAPAKPKPKPYVHASGEVAFGALPPKAAHQAELFTSRLKTRARHLRRWPSRRGITCFRLYERDVPEIPLVVDRYEDHLHITEYERPHDRDLAQHANWLDLMAETAAIAMEIPKQNVHMKIRGRQRGKAQHGKYSESNERFVVNEGGLKFLVNLVDFVDTGLFLDHRVTRGMVRDRAEGKHFLNLFAYTGAFSVYAAAGGAKTTTTVDLSQNYLDWAKDNMALNQFGGNQHQYIAADLKHWIQNHPPGEQYDLVVLDPPTFSNSKRTDDDWDLQTDAMPLLNQLMPLVRKGGVVYFSNNFRRFKFDPSELAASDVVEISKQTVPEDYRNRRIHRCWRIVR